jgi:hypothetical protein
MRGEKLPAAIAAAQQIFVSERIFMRRTLAVFRAGWEAPFAVISGRNPGASKAGTRHFEK